MIDIGNEGNLSVGIQCPEFNDPDIDEIVITMTFWFYIMFN